MRTLLAQIYEQGAFHDNAVTQKRGLYHALSARGAVTDFDYLANARATLYDGFVQRIEYLGADLVLTQFHAADVLTPAQLRQLKERFPQTVFCNWSGDSWAWSLTSPAILELAREYDLWLVAAPDVLSVYAERGINARFWQIAYEPPVVPLPDMPPYDVVFLGNVISDKRRALLELLRTLEGVSVGIYGDWTRADGHNTYDFAAGEALYRNATLAIADMAYPDQSNYVSNRPIQILAAGGALLLHQHVPKMATLLGIQAGVDYIEWQTLADLPAVIADWLRPERAAERLALAVNGRATALQGHTWEARVRVLLDDWLPTLKEEQLTSSP